jgi:hypothetical protein
MCLCPFFVFSFVVGNLCANFGYRCSHFIYRHGIKIVMLKVL